MSAIPPIEPARPAHGVRPVRRRASEEEWEERPAPGHDGQEQEPRDDDRDDGLPHVDIRV
jgi:hypothetical protein